MIKRVSAPEGKAAAAIAAQTVTAPAIRKRSEMTPSSMNIIPSNICGTVPFSKGSTGSLGSLGSLGMNGPEANFPKSGAPNETFNLSSDGLSSFLGSSNSVGLSSKISTRENMNQNEPFQVREDFSAFGKPFFWGPGQNGSTLSLLSNFSGGGLSSSSANNPRGLHMNGSELNFFKDLFQPIELENDVPLQCPSTGYSIMNDVPTSFKQNSVFENPSLPFGHGNTLGPEYVASNGFLEKKPGCLEPTIDELLGLITEGEEKNEDLNRSEAVFPSKLHRMLQDAKREGFEHIVSWIHGGTAFKVHDVSSFMKEIMPIYFDQSKFESFRRQLNLYGFTRVTRGPSRGMYYHQDFVQNDPSLCQNISRPKSVRKRRKQSSDVGSVVLA